MPESCLLSGPLEPTNEWCDAGIKLCQAYRRQYGFDAMVFLINTYLDEGLINVGVGEEVTIRELAELIGRIVGFNGEIHFDPTKPDGTPHKLLDVTRLHTLGWRASTSLEDGVRATYAWYLSNVNARGV